MESNYVLEAVNITKRFPGVLANDAVCLNVHYGEVLGLIGENGAGKSTLLKILNGIYPAGTYEGTLLLEGREIRPTSPLDAIEQGIGYVPQEINVLKNFSVAENIYMSNLRLENLQTKKREAKRPLWTSGECMQLVRSCFGSIRLIWTRKRMCANCRWDSSRC